MSLKIVGITACVAGIAHTYMVATKIVQAAEAAGHTCKIETQGTMGVQNRLSAQDIEACDVVILSHDIPVKGLERFQGKLVVDLPVNQVMRRPKTIMKAIEEQLNQK